MSPVSRPPIPASTCDSSICCTATAHAHVRRRLLSRQDRHHHGERGRGGGYDTLARTLARFLTRHLPGNPIVLGAQHGGRRRACGRQRAVQRRSETDGTYIGLLQSQTPVRSRCSGARGALRRDQIQLARHAEASRPDLFVLWNAVPVDTLAQAEESDITVGAAGANSTPAFHARLLNDVFGLKLKIKTGYPALTDAFYGLERGEARRLHQRDPIRRCRRDQIRLAAAEEDQGAAAVRAGKARRSSRGVPFRARCAPRTKRSHPARRCVRAPLALGRPLVMPPGVPAERLAAMRKAVMETFADPGFISESARDCRSGRASRTMAKRCRKWSPAHLRGAAKRLGSGYARLHAARALTASRND